jgi:hypothetical protein
MFKTKLLYLIMLFFLNLAIGQSGNPQIIYQHNFKERRQAFRAKMPANTVAVFW